MGEIIEVDFKQNSLSDRDNFIEEVQPILQDLVDVAHHNFGEVLASELLCDVVEVLYKYTSENNYVLTMDNGDIIDINLDNKD
jgi:hypothetical protein|tara:strand:+ start:98 stop:346 length:249 start_codon:yes stop_codon:yes gene_type:complete